MGRARVIPGAEGVALGRAMQGRRDELSLTQAQVAERVGCPRATYAKYESGDSVPSMERIAAIADALDLSISELVQLAGL